MFGGFGTSLGETNIDADGKRDAAAKTETGKRASDTKQSNSTKIESFFKRSMAGIQVSFSGVWPKVRILNYIAEDANARLGCRVAALTATNIG